MREDVLQIAEVLVEDWKTAYRGIVDSDCLDSMCGGSFQGIQKENHDLAVPQREL